MNPTHDPNHDTAQPRHFGENFLVDLFTDKDLFTAWIASANGTTGHPAATVADGESDGYTLTDKGRAALAGADEEPVAFVAVRGWCEQCGRALPWKCTWDEPLCPDCVTFTPLSPGQTEPGAAASGSPAEESGTAGVVLRLAAQYLLRHGWIQGAYYDPSATVFTPAADMVGAIAMVCYGGPCEAPAQHFDHPGFLDFEEAVLHLDRFLLAEDGSQSYEFNDARGRRAEDVIDVLHRAASRPAHELIDALRAIAAHEATLRPEVIDRVKVLTPGGIWAEIGSCPCCGSACRRVREVIDDGDGPAYCEHEWHDVADLVGGDAE